ncbi:hypothetical protein BST95_09140 [Halioglobus japonicus]|uniref:Uncharacterized protein n=1 Tax=Halioglobus japonicus TaxID=930805 RepID=A0AAP8MEN1_9GAMM|nr:hypothetical protein [Halioglobus japonicus]AQA18374.1 hypothetical protein BST95_09140 [Halioglobus japonicus]PLW86390.1 hypothetical protein C0029_08180 [Halioglobus japonicus]GHD13126.1 hypothetical protein GCM10007052_14900 [Halioglobus japonicus]
MEGLADYEITGATSLEERALRTHLGKSPAHLLRATSLAQSQERCTEVKDSRQLLADVDEYLSAKPEGAEISNEYLMEQIRQRLEC